MALPTLDKTWQHDTNNTLTGTAAVFSRNIMFAIKEALIGFPLAPWVPARSSNSVSAGAGDLWLAATDITFVGASGAHSWIVLQQDGISTGFQLLIDCLGNSNGELANFYISPAAGFAGGTHLVRPTATDEVYLYGAPREWGGSNINPGGSVQIMQSTDGACTRVVILGNNYDRGLWLIDRIKNPKADMTVPWLAAIHSANVVTKSYLETIDFVGTDTCQAYRGGARTNVQMTLEGTRILPLNQVMLVPDDVTGEYPMMPVGLYASTSGARGRIGEVYDFWFGTEAFGIPTVNFYPDDASKQFCQFHDVILPWDGVTVPLWSF